MYGHGMVKNTVAYAMRDLRKGVAKRNGPPDSKAAWTIEKEGDHYVGQPGKVECIATDALMDEIDSILK